MSPDRCDASVDALLLAGEGRKVDGTNDLDEGLIAMAATHGAVQRVMHGCVQHHA